MTDDVPQRTGKPNRSSLRALAVLGWFVAISASGQTQGWVYLANYIPTLPVTLNEPFSGCSGLLLGSGYTAQLFAGPAGTPDGNLQPMLPLTSFRTDPSQAGRLLNVGVVIPGVPPGQIARVQVRVWDNRGGTITSWPAALANPTNQLGASVSFDSPPLTAQNTSEPVILTGLRRFSICQTHLSTPVLVGPNVFSINLTGVPGRQYAIDSATEFGHWSPLFTVVNVLSDQPFTVTNAPPAGVRFYRARIAP